MRILVAAGNTSTKWQLRSSGDPVAGGQGDLRALRDWVAALDDSEQYAVAVSCVKDDTYAHEIGRAFESLGGATLHFVKSSATLPVFEMRMMSRNVWVWIDGLPY